MEFLRLSRRENQAISRTVRISRSIAAELPPLPNQPMVLSNDPNALRLHYRVAPDSLKDFAAKFSAMSQQEKDQVKADYKTRQGARQKGASDDPEINCGIVMPEKVMDFFDRAAQDLELAPGTLIQYVLTRNR